MNWRNKKMKYLFIVMILVSSVLVTPHSYASDEELYERVALEMSEMKCPDFSMEKKETVYAAFNKIWQTPEYKKNWMHNLKNRISELSNGQVKLAKGDKEKFPIRIKGPAEYFLLINDEKIMMVIMQPSESPILCL